MTGIVGDYIVGGGGGCCKVNMKINGIAHNLFIHAYFISLQISEWKQNQPTARICIQHLEVSHRNVS